MWGSFSFYFDCLSAILFSITNTEMPITIPKTAFTPDSALFSSFMKNKTKR